MLTVQGIYDKGAVQIKETIPTFERCEVFVTFLPVTYEVREKETASDDRKEAFDFLMNSPKISLTKDFDCKKEFKNALRKKYENID